MYFVIASAFVYFFNYFKLTNYFQTRKSAITGIILGYIYITFDMMYLFLQHFNLRYAILIAGILLFILIQAFFIIIIFFISRRRQKKVYQDKFTEEQVENLKSYTDRLEKDQLKLRHFKHDYKNLLFSLRTVADEQDYDAMNQALDNLENYSDDYLNNLSMDLYKDLNNVKNPYLKSLFISKLNTINKNNIVSYFNCYDELTDVPINILDLINLLSQAIDNAIEYTKDQEHGAIQLSITKEDQQLAFLINNTVSKVPTTKKETDGLEKLHIKNLKKKYSNIFIQYSKNDKWFRFHITLITKGD
ncbi:signal transduction protein [Companilactobacillus kimchiensis]|uniref:Signal transduction protein n=2 Tax=Companilactobacillus kimchiensis TaxID=993692 RepID=A0A0R2LL02_9LACO|nr:signal transduction protein [Companilactobacillus kimchiensis]